MKLTLSENIRSLRKQRKMTQEKLAETLGVTVGAVYKWESGLSLPELSLIVKMADFFDTSVDVLLGYKMKNNSPDSILERLEEYCLTMDAAALEEAEIALGKYPHSFKIVHTCAKVYLAFGSGNHDQKLMRRSLELFELSRTLLPQNDDPRISDATICSEMSVILMQMGERETGLDLLKKNNAGAIFSSSIGMDLAAFMDRPEEASSFLSEGLLNGISDILTSIVGYVFLFRSRGDASSALDIVKWGIDLLSGLKTQTETDAVDRVRAQMFALLAYVQELSGMREESCASLKIAASYAKRFDSMPDYSLKTLRFADHTDQIMIFDIFGSTASESVSGMIRLLGDEALAKQWEEVSENEC